MRRKFLNSAYKNIITVKNYFTIEALEDGLQVRLSINALSVNACEYSLDGNTWNRLPTATNTPTVNTGEKIYFRGNLIPDSSIGKGIGTFTISKKCNVKGNVMSLLYGDDFIGKTDLTGKNYALDLLFYNCKIVDASELILPATTLANQCYREMFRNCTGLTAAPKLPAITLADHCYYCMFSGCSSLITAPELPATTLAGSCYSRMFYNCTSLTTVSQLPATELVYGCYSEMFSGCSRLITAPELPATTLASDCYNSMFYNCGKLTTAPELPATTLAGSCYDSMFRGCTGLTIAPQLPATTLETGCYYDMFRECKSLTTAPKLPATILAEKCYYNMFYSCIKLNYIMMSATDISATNCLYDWVYNVSSSGTFVKNVAMTSLPTGTNGIPSGWTVEDNFYPVECRSLSITADNVPGKVTTTKIYYTAEIYGHDDNNNYITITKIGETVSEEFPQNTSETETVTRTISYTYMGVTATTTIIHGVWVNSHYTINLNSNWQLSTSVNNPDSNTYDGVYESYSNYNVNNGVATMYIDIEGYTDFKLYIRSYAESNYDYVMVSQLDQTITGSTAYSNTTLIKAHTRGSQNSDTSISGYKLVEFTGITVDPHRITIVYRKDSGANSGTDRGYVLIPKNVEDQGNGNDTSKNLITFTIDGVEYQAEEGMTWGEWCESEYNTDGYNIIGTNNHIVDSSDLFYVKLVKDSSVLFCTSEMLIIEDENYALDLY